MSHSGDIFGFMLLAQAELVHAAWAPALINYGALGLWVIFMVWRDNRESIKQDKRHEEQITQQRRVEEAFRINTESIIISVSAMKTIDRGYAELLERIKADNARK